MDLLPLLGRVAVSLAAVLTLVWLLSKAARRRGAGRAVDAARFTVVARQSLSKAAGVTVMRVGEDALVLGVTDSSVQLLARMPLEQVTAEAPAPVRRAEELVLTGTGAATTVADPAPSRRRLPALASLPALPSLVGRRTVLAGAASTSTIPSRGALAGSALSPATWTTAVEALRERTTRR